MSNPKDPAYPNINGKTGNTEFYSSPGMTIELQIASRILAARLGASNTGLMFKIKSAEVTIHQWALNHARILIEEANK